VVFKNGRMLITRRKPDGLLGGLWEFPGGKVGPEESSSQACIREIKEEVNLDIAVTEQLTTIRHAYTHFKITLDVFICRYRGGRVRLSGPEDFRWIRMRQIDAFPFPKANAKFIPLLKEKWGSNLDY
jgi:A/G-specific adenine glycosylase